MSDDPLIRQLSRFTPDGAGLDRDALLFAAGKASARPNRRWMAVAGALAASQLAVLGLFLLPQRHEPLPVMVSTQMVASLPASEEAAPDPSSYLYLRARLLSDDGSLPPLEAVEAGSPDDPPLRAFGPLSSELFN